MTTLGFYCTVLLATLTFLSDQIACFVDIIQPTTIAL